MTLPPVPAARKAQSPGRVAGAGDAEAVGGGAVIGARTAAARVAVGVGVKDAGTSVGTIMIGGRSGRAAAVRVGEGAGGSMASAGGGRGVVVRVGGGVGRAVAVAEGEGDGLGIVGEAEAAGEGAGVRTVAGTAVGGGGSTGLVDGGGGGGSSGVGVGAGAETSGTRVTSFAVTVLGPQAEAASVAAAMKETQAFESARMGKILLR